MCSVMLLQRVYMNIFWISDFVSDRSPRNDVALLLPQN